jgi:hypothetical protein
MDAFSIILLYYSKCTNGSPIDVDISFISIKPPPSCGTSISDWKFFICQLAAPVDETSEPTFNIESAIKAINIYITLDNFADSKIIQAFNTDDIHAVPFNSNTHYEAILAVLTDPKLKNSIGVAISDELLLIIEVYLTYIILFKSNSLSSDQT